MLEGDVDNLLAELLRAKPYKPPLHRSSYAVRADQISRVALIGSFVLFLIMLVPAGLIYFEIDSSWLIKLIGQGLGIISMIFALGCLLLSFTSSAISILRVSKDFDEDLLAQKNHDMKLARRMLKFTEGSVEYSRKVLEIKMRRIESRIADFFGSSDKVALISIAGMGWALYKEGADFEKLFTSLPAAFLYILYVVFALLFGVCIGAIAMKGISRKYRYALEILELSDVLRQKDTVGKISKL